MCLYILITLSLSITVLIIRRRIISVGRRAACEGPSPAASRRLHTSGAIIIAIVIIIIIITVSFHNFKSQNVKLSVSNPKSKYVAYLSVLSRISNCQGLGRKNKLEMLKTDRIIAASSSLRTSPRGRGSGAGPGPRNCNHKYCYHCYY